MTSNIKKRPDYVRLFLAISSVLVVLVLVFCAFNGFGLKIADIQEAIKPGTESDFKVFSLSLLDLMTGFTIGGEKGTTAGVTFSPVVVNGLRAAFILLIIAIVVAVIIIFGILSKRFSYKTLKILAIANAVILVAIAALILCTKPLISKEVTDLYGGDLPEYVVTATDCKTIFDLIMKYSTLGWGAIAAASTALVAAVSNVVVLIYAKANKIEL